MKHHPSLEIAFLFYRVVCVKLNPPPEFTGCTHQALSPLHNDLLLASTNFIRQHHDLKIDLKALTTKQGVVSKLEDLAKKLRSN